MDIICRTSNTVTQGVNTVDTLFAAFPAFLYLNPELAGYLLVPLLNYQDSPAYTQQYAAKNIGQYDTPCMDKTAYLFDLEGSSYPNATADSINAAHPYGVEGDLSSGGIVSVKPELVLETSNMLIMILAYTQLSGNDTLIKSHYNSLRKWGQYLGNNSLTPNDQ